MMPRRTKVYEFSVIRCYPQGRCTWRSWCGSLQVNLLSYCLRLVVLFKIFVRLVVSSTLPGQKDGTTPLFMAARKGYLEVVRALLSAGADPSMCSGATAAACSKAHPMSIFDGSEQGCYAPFNCDACSLGGQGKRWFCRACCEDLCFHCLPETSQHEVTAPTSPLSPLSVAAREGHTEVVDALRSAGANL